MSSQTPPYLPWKISFQRSVLFGVIAFLPLLAIGAWLLAGFFAPRAQAAGINHQINYQGKIASSSGTAVPDGDYGFCFEFFNDQSGGSSYGWSEDWTSLSSAGEVSVRQGIFSVNLGSSTPISSNIFSNKNVYLEVSFDADANGTCEDVFYPRKRVTASPYAFNSETVNGFSASTTAVSNTIPVLDNLAGLALNGVTTTNIFSSYSSLGVVSSGTWNGAIISAQYGGTGLDTSSLTGFAYINGGAWEATTTLVGAETDPYWMAASTTLSYLNFSTSAVSQWTNDVGYLTTSTLSVTSSQWVTSGSNIYYNTGNVGIGTTNPAHTLDINGDINIFAGSSLRYNGTQIAWASTTLGNFLLAGARNINIALMTGTNNLAVGQDALFSNTTGTKNVVVGNASLQNNTSGHDNTVVGYGALVANTTGNENLAFGSAAMVRNTIGNNNVGIGDSALSWNIDGSSNTALGNGAGNQSNGSNNLFLGFSADLSFAASTSNNAIAIGYNAKVGGSNMMALGGTGADAVKVGIGLTTPSTALEVAGIVSSTGLVVNGGVTMNVNNQNLTINGNGNIQFGSNYLLTSNGNIGSNSFRWNNLYVDNASTSQVTTTNLTIGTLTGLLSAINGVVTTTPTSSLGILPSGNDGQLLVYNSGWQASSQIYVATSTGYVGIGTTTPNNLLQVYDLIDFNNTDKNTKIGYQAGKNIVSGAVQNTFFGYQAGFSSSTAGTDTADWNTAVGYLAFHSNSTGQANSAFGYQSLKNNTAGHSNAAFGLYALQQNTTGNWNTAFGRQALQANTTGNENLAFGGSALSRNTAGNDNTGIGDTALSYNITGSYNTALGYMAGNVSIGSNNLFLGYNSNLLYDASSSNNAIAIGYNAKVGGSNMMTLGGLGVDAVNVGIGTSTPVATLAVSGTAYITGTTTASCFTVDGVNCITGSGSSSSQWITTGSDIYYNIGNVGIGLTTPSTALEVAGIVSSTGLVVNGGVTMNVNNQNLTINGNGNIQFGSNYLLTSNGNIGSNSFRWNNLYVDNASTSQVTTTNLTIGTLTGLLSAINGVVTTTPTSSLGILPSGNDGNILYYNSGWLATSSLTVATSTGYIGIGTTTPNNLLQVYYLIDFGSNDMDIANTRIGYQAGKNLAAGAQYNTFLGYQAGYSSSTGSTNAADANTAIGYQSLYLNASGYNNISVGHRTLFSNITGFDNTAIGANVLTDNTGGDKNTAIGANALMDNTVGDGNVAIGWDSLVANIDGAFNTAIGLGTLYLNETGKHNTAVGYEALYKNVSGDYNTAIGYYALASSTGDRNVALGYLAGSHETGSDSFYVDNQERYTAAGDKAGALLYGTFNATSVNQTLRINASTTIVQNLTVLGTGVSSFSGTVSSTGLVVNGGVTMNVNNQNLTINGNGNIQFGTNYFLTSNGNLGASNAYWNNLYVTNVSSSRVTTTNLIVLSTSTLRDIIPDMTGATGYVSAYSIGASTTRWNNAWISNLYLGSSTWQFNQGGDGHLSIGNVGGAERLAVSTSGVLSVGNMVSTTALRAIQFSQQSTTSLESAPLGPERATSTGWTSDGWIGSYETGFTPIPGSSTPLRFAMSSTQNQLYQVSFTIISTTAGYVTVGLGGVESTDRFGTSGFYSPKISSTNGDLIFTPHNLVGDFDGTISNISVKQIIGTYSGIYNIADNSGVSNFEIRSSLSALENIFIGKNVGKYNVSGYGNTALGAAALQSNTSGYGNTAVGKSALADNITGDNNTAQGYIVLTNNITGYNNTAQGAAALAYNNAGYNNTAQGAYALYANTTGYNNTAQGISALFKNSSGSGNTAQGVSALGANTIGQQNTAQGNGALANNISGNYNTAQGYVALHSNTIGNQNVANGYQALYSNTSGTSNTAIGYQAGYDTTVDTRSVYDSQMLFLGALSSRDPIIPSTTPLTNSIAIGYNAKVATSNVMVLGSGVNVGIGTNAPTTKLEVVGTISSTNLVIGGSVTTTGALSASSLTLTTDLSVSNGGTGVSSLATNGILYGAGTGAVQTTVGTAGYLLMAGASGLPGWIASTTFASSSHNHDTVYVNVSGDTMSGALTVNNDITATGTVFSTNLRVSGNATTTGQLYVLGTSTMRNIIPETNLAHNLGSSALRWDNLWADTLNVGTSTWSVTASTGNGRLAIYDAAQGEGNERLSILTNGHVGIGTTTPNNLLQVYDLVDFNNDDYNTKIGYQAGKNVVSGAIENTFIGYQAGFSSSTASADVADYNTAIGYQSLYSNTSGDSNTAIGESALYSNTEGYANTANGNWALYSNITGFLNTAVGVSALTSNTTGDSNTAVGVSALFTNTSGYSNTAIGVSALSANTEGFNNTAIGVSALTSNTKGGGNVAIGDGALYSNNGDGGMIDYFHYNGSVNTAIGESALYSNTEGVGNSAQGSYSLYSNTTGLWNSAQGSYSLYSNTTGNYNTANGYLSLYSNTSGNSNTAIGASALTSNTEGSNNIAFGDSALNGNTAGSNNVALGYSAGLFDILGSNNVFLGPFAGAHETGDNSFYVDNQNRNSSEGDKAGALLYGVFATSSVDQALTINASTTINGTTTIVQNLRVLGTGISSFAGHVGIGTTSPAEALDVKGNIQISAGNYLKYNGSVLAYASTTKYNYFFGEAGTSTAAGLALETGVNNVGIGYQSLKALTTGYSNVGIGYQALHSNIEGGSNIAIGSSALHSSTSSSNNIAIGSSALATTSGSGNIAIGSSALTANAIGFSNVAIGNLTLTDNTNGIRNTAIGAQALSNLAGSINNTSRNTALGDIAGVLQADEITPLTTANQSVYIGASTMGYNNSDVNSIVIGYMAKGIGANTVVLGNDNILTTALKGKVGIDTSTPDALLHVYKVSPSAGENMFLISNSSTPLFRFSASGTAYADDSWQSGGADYAEYFYTRDTGLSSGEAVCVDVAKDNAVVRCTRAGDDNIMGIVSTRPAIVGNSKEGYENNPNYKIVAMLGQIPAKASTENGEIRPGDYLTAASVPGYIMKAGTGDATVGVALESLSAGEGTINVMISRRNKSLTVEQVEDAVTQRIADMELEDEVNIMLADTIRNYDFTDDIAAYMNPFIASVDAKLTLLTDTLALKVGELASTTLGADNALSSRILAANDLISLLNEQVSTTASSLSVTNEKVEGLDSLVLANNDRLTNLELFTSSSIADLQAAITNLTVATTSGDLQVEDDLLTVNSLIVRQSADFIGTITVRGEANFEAKVTFKKPIVLAADSAGTAMIKSGEKSVEVKFSENYGAEPKIVANLNNDDENIFIIYKIASKTTSSFRIILAEPAEQDLNFDWLAFAATPPATTTETLPEEQPPVPAEPVMEEPIVIEEAPIIEEPVIEELPPVENPVIEGDVITQPDPAGETPVEETPVEEAPAEVAADLPAVLPAEEPAAPEVVTAN